MDATKYYVVNRENVSPNALRSAEEFWTVVIQTEPERTNSSHQIRIEGWCGTTNDMSVTAHGEFDSFEEAKTYVEENWTGRWSDECDCCGFSVSENEKCPCGNVAEFIPAERIYYDACDWFVDGINFYLKDFVPKSENLDEVKIEIERYLEEKFCQNQEIDDIPVVITDIDRYVDDYIEKWEHYEEYEDCE